MASHIVFPFVSLLSQSWKKLHNSVAFKLLSHLTEMYQHIEKIWGQDTKVTPCKFAALELNAERDRNCWGEIFNYRAALLFFKSDLLKVFHEHLCLQKRNSMIPKNADHLWENNPKYTGNTPLHINVKSSIIVTFWNVFPFFSPFIFCISSKGLSDNLIM